MSKLAHAASVACCKQLGPWCSRHGYTVDMFRKETVTSTINLLLNYDKIEYVVTVRGYLNAWSFSAIILHFNSRGVRANWLSDGLDQFVEIIYSKPSFFDDIENIVRNLSRTSDDVIDEFRIHCTGAHIR